MAHQPDMTSPEAKHRSDVVWSSPALHPQPARTSLYSRGTLRLTREELRYDLSFLNRIAGSRLFGMGTHVFESDTWRTDIREIVDVDVVERIPELSAHRTPRPRLRIRLRKGGEELFIVDEPDNASANLWAAIQRYRKER